MILALRKAFVPPTGHVWYVQGTACLIYSHVNLQFSTEPEGREGKQMAAPSRFRIPVPPDSSTTARALASHHKIPLDEVTRPGQT